MSEDLKFQFFMSRLTHVRDVKDTEKTHISIVLYEANQAYCILRECKGRDLSGVCEALCKVRHPNTVVVYDYVYANGNTYILEENITGTSLEEVLLERRFTEQETAKLMMALCEGLEPLHALQPPLVHNDINPSNILLREDGSIKLFDFDISRRYRPGVGQNTVLFGTEEYASPEHYGYGQSEPRTDIYCMGVTMHKMLTGKSLTVEHAMTYRGKLRPVIEKCLQLDPRRRYRDVRALQKDLDRFLKRKKRLLYAVLTVTAGLLLGCMLLWGWYSGTEKPGESTQRMQTEQAAQTEEVDLPQSTPSATENRPTDPPTTESTGTQVVEPTQPLEGVTEQPSTAPTGNHTEKEAMPIGISEACPVILKAELSNYYVFTVPEKGQYIVTLENRSVPCRVFYSGDRGLGSLFSGWVDQGDTTNRSFRADPGDQVYIQIKARDALLTGECVLRIDPA